MARLPIRSPDVLFLFRRRLLFRDSFFVRFKLIPPELFFSRNCFLETVPFVCQIELMTILDNYWNFQYSWYNSNSWQFPNLDNYWKMARLPIRSPDILFLCQIELMTLTFGLMVGIGGSLAYTPSLVILGHYFRKRMGIVNGFVTAGSSLFTIIMPFFFDFILSNYSLKVLFQILSALMAFLMVSICSSTCDLISWNWSFGYSHIATKWAQ